MTTERPLLAGRCGAMYHRFTLGAHAYAATLGDRGCHGDPRHRRQCHDGVIVVKS